MFYNYKILRINNKLPENKVFAFLSLFSIIVRYSEIYIGQEIKLWTTKKNLSHILLPIR